MSKWVKSEKHGQAMRILINRNANTGKKTKSTWHSVERYLDDIALSNAVKLANEGMKGFKA